MRIAFFASILFLLTSCPDESESLIPNNSTNQPYYTEIVPTIEWQIEEEDTVRQGLFHEEWIYLASDEELKVLDEESGAIVTRNDLANIQALYPISFGAYIRTAAQDLYQYRSPGQALSFQFSLNTLGRRFHNEVEPTFIEDYVIYFLEEEGQESNLHLILRDLNTGQSIFDRLLPTESDLVSISQRTAYDEVSGKYFFIIEEQNDTSTRVIYEFDLNELMIKKLTSFPNLDRLRSLDIVYFDNQLIFEVDRNLMVYDLNADELAWETDIGGIAFTQIQAREDILYFLSFDGQYMYIDFENESLKHISTISEFERSPELIFSESNQLLSGIIDFTRLTSIEFRDGIDGQLLNEVNFEERLGSFIHANFASDSHSAIYIFQQSVFKLNHNLPL